MSEWFGALPERWESKRIGGLLQQRKEKNDPVKTDFILSLSAAHGVVPYSERVEKGGNKPKNDLTKYFVAHENDLLVNCMNVLAGSCGVSKWYGAISPVYYALYPRNAENINIWYYNYIFRLNTFYRSLIGISKGILAHESTTGSLNTIRLRVAMQNMNYIMMPLPPRAEQDQIVRFLDWKVSKINHLINVKKKQITLLGELKQTIITRAVIGGLKQNVQTKSSGILGLERIPEHWNSLRLGQALCNIEQGWSPQASERTEAEQWSVVALSCINRGLFTPTEIKPIDKPQQKSIELIQLYEGDLLMTRSNVRERVGDVAIVHNPLPNTIFSDLIYRLTPTSIINVEFLTACLLSRVGRNQIEVFARGSSSTMPKITQGHIKSLIVPLPPIDEQEEIVSYIDVQNRKIDNSLSAVHKEIDLLHEYRTRLISDVVTGKLDVRDAVIPNYEAVEEIAVVEDVVNDSFEGAGDE